jgi:hypothetical protein
VPEIQEKPKEVLKDSKDLKKEKETEVKQKKGAKPRNP